ncbi:MAG: phage tail protein [Eubacteriaceae bacterium]
MIISIPKENKEQIIENIINAPKEFTPILFSNDMTFKQFLDIGNFTKFEDDCALPSQYILNIEYIDTKTIVYGDYLLFADGELNWQLYIVCEPYDEYSSGIKSFIATCKHVLNILDDDRNINTVFEGETLENAIATCLVKSQFTATFNDVGLSAENVYRKIECESPISAIQFICENLKCEFKPRIIINISNPITVDLYLDFYYSLGLNKGLILKIVYNTDISNILFDDSNLATALEGTGTDKQGNVIDIYDIQWSISNGDPLDKPLNQTFLEDPEATNTYGISVGEGSSIKKPVFDFYTSQSMTPETLIWDMYEQIQKRKAPLINYPVNLKLLESIYKNQKVELGDTIRLILVKNENIIFTGNVRVVRIILDRLYSENDKVELSNVISPHTHYISKYILKQSI